jgi:hypothetical protein
VQERLLPGQQEHHHPPALTPEVAALAPHVAAGASMTLLASLANRAAEMGTVAWAASIAAGGGAAPPGFQLVPPIAFNLGAGLTLGTVLRPHSPASPPLPLSLPPADAAAIVLPRGWVWAGGGSVRGGGRA